MTSHHAVLIGTEFPMQFVSEAFFPQLEYRQAQLGIDMVRTIIQAAHLRPSSGASEQLILVATEFITEEAQQALLKIIEEPPLSTKFVFVLPSGYTLLPTLESRFERKASEQSEVDSSVFQTFLHLSYAERISAIEESTKKKDLVWQTNIKRGLLGHILAHHVQMSGKVLIELEYIARTLLTRGASNKFLLEHLALTLPS
jgi:DNA polymerase III delta prime subunit